MPISKIKKILWKLFGVKYYIEDIKLLSILHYTLYENFPNIVKNIKYIKLYSNSGNNNNNIKKSIKIYLGQPLNEVLPEFNSNMLVTCLNSLNIDYYFPHPREKYNLNLKEIKYIKTSLIFEDYIINYLKQNPDTQVEIFSFISTAILNVKDLERVKVYYIYNREALKEFKDFYSFISKNFSVKILNINDEGV